MIALKEGAPMKDSQQYVHDLEEMHGWLDVDLVHTCLLMGEEVGELFKVIRKHMGLFDQTEVPAAEQQQTPEHVSEE